MSVRLILPDDIKIEADSFNEMLDVISMSTVLLFESNKHTKLPKGVDIECRNLCKALNLFPGINTIESCCGHGKNLYQIAFESANLHTLKILLKAIRSFEYYRNWRITSHYATGGDGIYHLIEYAVDKGELAYKFAKYLASHLEIERKKLGVFAWGIK